MDQKQPEPPSNGVIGILCCAGAAALYFRSHYCDGTVEALRSATRVREIRDLAPLLSNAARNVLPLVEVSGNVGSDTPMISQSSNFEAVVMEKVEKHHYLKRNDKEEWKNETTEVSSKWTEVPWYLDDGTGCVTVSCARSELSARMVSCSVFENSNELPYNKDLEERGFKMVRVEKIERSLRIGTPLTVVGEAYKDRTGTIRIRKPLAGGPFYVSKRTVPQIIADNQTGSSFCKYVSVGLAAVGFTFLLS